MAEYILVDKEQLEADLKIVADSIRAKGGTIEALEFPLGMKSAVDNIQKGIDISSSTPATSSDMANGKEAFVNGEKVTGSVTVINEDVDMGDKLIWNADKGIVTDILLTGDFLMRKGIHINQYLSKDKLGNATPNDVAQGVSFTSESGIKIDGGLQSLSSLTINPQITGHEATGQISLQYKVGTAFIAEKGCSFWTWLDYIKFGNAKLGHVLEGSTFTASAGYQVQGTIPKVASYSITPSAEDQIAFPKGSYASGDITVLGDPNLKAENIKSGVTIFDIEGTCETATSGALAMAKAKSLTLGTFRTSGSSTSLLVSVKKSIKIVDGVITDGVGYGSVTFNKNSDVESIMKTLRGNYVVVGSDYYYIPNTSECSMDLASYNYSVNVTEACQMFILA